MSKRFQMLPFRGSTQGKSASKIFRFCYKKAANDPAVAGVPDPVGSGLRSRANRRAVALAKADRAVSLPAHARNRALAHVSEEGWVLRVERGITILRTDPSQGFPFESKLCSFLRLNR